MLQQNVILILLVLFFSLSITTIRGGAHHHRRRENNSVILLEFLDSITSGPQSNCFSDGWRSIDSDPCIEKWSGVSCLPSSSSGGDDVVSKLFLSACKPPLRGAISPAVAKLKNLTVLDLANNELSGTIPAELGLMKQLQGVYLSYNPQLTGPLPDSLGNLSQLVDLQVSACNITTARTKPGLPKSFRGMKNLEILWLDSNPLLDVSELPEEWGSLSDGEGGMTRLQHVELSGCAGASRIRKLPSSWLRTMKRLKYFNASTTLVGGEEEDGDSEDF